jgi:hypothetical protein
MYCKVNLRLSHSAFKGYALTTITDRVGQDVTRKIINLKEKKELVYTVVQQNRHEIDRICCNG